VKLHTDDGFIKTNRHNGLSQRDEAACLFIQRIFPPPDQIFLVGLMIWLIAGINGIEGSSTVKQGLF